MAYLGVIKAGYAVASIADSFAPEEIANTSEDSIRRASSVTQDRMLRAGKTLPMYQKVAEGRLRGRSRVGLEQLRPCSFEIRKTSRWADFLAEDETFEPAPATLRTRDELHASRRGRPVSGRPSRGRTPTPIKCAMDGYLHHDIHPRR